MLPCISACRRIKNRWRRIYGVTDPGFKFFLTLWRKEIPAWFSALYRSELGFINERSLK
jgi:hypothetical protein